MTDVERLTALESRVTALTREIEAAKKILEERNAELEEAESNLQATQIHAPVDGIILARKGVDGACSNHGYLNAHRNRFIWHGGLLH